MKNKLEEIKKLEEARKKENESGCPQGKKIKNFQQKKENFFINI